MGDATRCGPQARGSPLDTRGHLEIVSVGDATRCGPQARGIPLDDSLNNRGVNSSFLFRCTDPTFQNHVFTRPHFFHFPIVSRNYFLDTIPFRFPFSDSQILRFTIHKKDTDHTVSFL